MKKNENELHTVVAIEFSFGQPYNKKKEEKKSENWKNHLSIFTD
jgi:hypothetical protein